MVTEVERAAGNPASREGVTRTVTEKSWVAEATGVSRGLSAAIAVVGVAGTAGLVWAGVSDSPYWFLAVLLSGPLAALFGLIAIRGKVAVPLGTTVADAHGEVARES